MQPFYLKIKRKNPNMVGQSQLGQNIASTFAFLD